MPVPKRTTTAAGYGNAHQKLRKVWATKVDAGQVNCWRCGRWIRPGTPWDLGHDDRDRGRYRGPEHARCNRATATHNAKRKRRRITGLPRWSRNW